MRGDEGLKDSRNLKWALAWKDANDVKKKKKELVRLSLDRIK